MLILNSPQVTQETALRWKADGKIALVPTMGCLHEGHLQLVRFARQFAKKVVVSLFVNPLQFGPNEDLARYPRTYEADVEALRRLEVDLLFHPTSQDLYPQGFQTRVAPGPLTASLCGPSRPGHFEGVATVCLKLFLTTQADFAVFGEKDFQQLRVIQQMTADFNMPVSILPHPTVRESDNLALSSRNRYLGEIGRETASQFPAALLRAQAKALADGALPCGQLLTKLRSELREAGIEVDYAAVAPESTLVPAADSVPIASLGSPRLFAAVRIGGTRLIDNWKLYGNA